jgi:hypothetical protein
LHSRRRAAEKTRAGNRLDPRDVIRFIRLPRLTEAIFPEVHRMQRRPALAILLALAALLSGPAPVPGAGPQAPGIHPVELAIGQAFDICSSGEILCPARVPICDDPGVAAPADLPGGLGFRAVSPGTTLCSAASAAGPRRVFRITVR